MSDESIDVEVLINAALKTKVKHDAEESAQITKKERRKELEKIVVHRFEEIKEVFSSIVNAFNEKSDDVILNQKSNCQLTIDIYPSKYKCGHVHVLVEAVHEHHELSGKKILAWGHVKASSGRGFNLILVCTSEDTYEWYILQIRYNNVYYIGPRQEPFPFEIHELPSELDIYGAHLYIKHEETFKGEHIIPLIKEIL